MMAPDLLKTGTTSMMISQTLREWRKCICPLPYQLTDSSTVCLVSFAFSHTYLYYAKCTWLTHEILSAISCFLAPIHTEQHVAICCTKTVTHDYGVQGSNIPRSGTAERFHWAFSLVETQVNTTLRDIGTCSWAPWLGVLAPVLALNTCTVFIQIDAHALIDAHPLHDHAPGRQKWVKLMIFVSKMHRSTM